MIGSSIRAALLYSSLTTAIAVYTPTDQNNSYGPLNFRAQFGNSPAPMKVDVSPAFIAETKLKASLTRVAIDLDQPPFVEGIPSQNIIAFRDYWVNHYDWSYVQDQLNKNFSHFTTTVGPLSSKFNYTRPIPLHFVHHKSPRSDAIPFLYIHGWPGSFAEVEKLIQPLTNPPADQPAFHVVSPDLPGFGFSPAPTAPGMGLIEAGAALNELMHQLGYDKYVVQGGDFGGHTSRYMASMFPESVVSILTNMYWVVPNATDYARQKANETTEQESDLVDFYTALVPQLNAFWGVEETIPMQMGMLLGDSPVGNLAWSYFGMRSLTPGYEWGVEDLINWTMMMYIQGPYGSGRMYVGMKKEQTLQGAFPYVKNPVGVLEYFGDANYGTPKDWCERTGNVTYSVQKPKDVIGGHFPAHANPDDLVSEIRKFWGSAAGGWKV